MENHYSFFSGYSKLKFSRNFSWGLFWAIFMLGLIFIWINWLSFSNSLIVSLILATGITLLLATAKTKNVVTYTVNKKEYLLYNQFLYYKKILNVDIGNPLTIDEKKFNPSEIDFIEEFLTDFIKCSESNCKQSKDYLKVFKKIKLEDIDFFYIHRVHQENKISEFLTLLQAMDETGLVETFYKALKMLREMLKENHEILDSSQLEILKRSFSSSLAVSDAAAQRMGYNPQEYRDILNK